MPAKRPLCHKVCAHDKCSLESNSNSGELCVLEDDEDGFDLVGKEYLDTHHIQCRGNRAHDLCTGNFLQEEVRRLPYLLYHKLAQHRDAAHLSRKVIQCPERAAPLSLGSAQSLCSQSGVNTGLSKAIVLFISSRPASSWTVVQEAASDLKWELLLLAPQLQLSLQ